MATAASEDVTIKQSTEQKKKKKKLFGLGFFKYIL
jgi:hypothetical protein